MKKLLALCLLFSLILTTDLFAQSESQPHPDNAPLDIGAIRFARISIEDGLSHPTVYAIVQDRHGFMWFGTAAGLNRFDGYRFDHFYFDTGDSSSPYGLGSSNPIAAIQEDGDGRLWILISGNNGVLDRFDPNTQTFTHFRNDLKDAGSPDPVLRAMHVGLDGTLWLGSTRGLSRFDPSTESFHPVDIGIAATGATGSSDANDTVNSVSVLLQDRQGVLWIGTPEGLIRYDPETGTCKRYLHRSDDPTSLSYNAILALHEDREGTLWVGTSWGLNRYEPASDSFERRYIDPKALDPGLEGQGVEGTYRINTIHAIREDHNGALWFGNGISAGRGLYRLERSSGFFRPYRHDPADPESLSDDSVLSIFEDGQHVLWIGTENGVSRVDLASRGFMLYRLYSDIPNKLRGGPSLGIFLDHEDVLWVSTEEDAHGSGVLNRFNRRSGTITYYRNNPVDPHSVGALWLRSPFRDSAGRFWIGTSRHGLNLLDEQTGRFTRYDQPGSELRHNVRFITEDRSGRLWLASGSRLQRFDAESALYTTYKLESGVSTDTLVNIIYEDLARRLWVGTVGKGLYSFDPSSEISTNYRRDPDHQESLTDNNVFALYERPVEPGVLWIGTRLGLNRLEMGDGRISHYTRSKTGLPGNMVYCIQGDRSGHLWMSTNQGIARFNPESEEWVRFRVKDGLQGLNFNPFACHQAETGELFFGGAGGVNAIMPDSVFGNPFPPLVALTELRLFNKPVALGSGSPLVKSLSETELLTLAHHQNDVSFQYVGLHYRHPKLNQYQYILEGYDAAWRQVGTLREATYTNLPPGGYTFRVTASNSDGVWNEDGASLRITILPPWWRTTWAYALYMLLLVGAVVGAYRVQHARIVRKERELAQIREAELRAEAAELQAKASDAQARTLEVENERNRLEVEKARELEKAYNKLKTTQKQLIQSEKMASLGQLTAGIAHEIKNPLNFVNNFSEVNEELTKELSQELLVNKENRIGEILDDLEDILGGIRVNSAHITKHGKRADSIVNNMMEHAREGGGQRLHVGLNPFVEENISLSHNSMLAQHSDFDVEIVRDLDEAISTVEMSPQEMGRALINVLNNAFDAVIRKKETAGAAYGPQVRVETRKVDTGVEIRIKDNGPGIPDKIKEKIFEPFFTTKPTGSGTGLGLSLAYDIVTQGHGGTMTVESTEGEGATFVITLPNPSH